tara:strand:+ start:457 stop:681 length:225 start_codon:yes stop_codon:yes gene_type:complete
MSSAMVRVGLGFDAVDISLESSQPEHRASKRLLIACIGQLVLMNISTGGADFPENTAQDNQSVNAGSAETKSHG